MINRAAGIKNAVAFLIAAIVGAALYKAVTPAEIEAYFSPSLECERNVKYRIDRAEKSIDAALFFINNRNLMNALKKAVKRGVRVRVLLDRKQAGKSAVKLRQDGIDVKIHSIFMMEHNKFAVYDDRFVSTGSYNWTYSATVKNSENCVFINDRATAERFADRFRWLWKINTRERSDEWFAERSSTADEKDDDDRDETEAEN